jgi:transposase
MDKCLDALPLRRQERIFQRIGAPLPISVLCALYHRCAEEVRPLYEALLAHVRVAEHVSADETPQPVLDEDKVRKGWMWVFATDKGILYVYSPSRGGVVPAAVLGTSKGTLTVDGHTGYNLVTRDGRRERGGCWSHGRRGLYEARSYAEAVVEELLELIGELYFIEHLAMEQQILGTASHLALRQERSAPVVARIYELIEGHVERLDERSSLAKAMRYLLNQREPLSLFLTNALVPIHNNLSERALRVVALLRNNSLFVGSDEGGEHLATLLTMAATCRMHDVDPEKWLTDVLIRIGERGSTVEELLPWNWKEARGANFAPVFDTG